ncbi:hypothetical protein ABTZ03_41070 [Kitasatospora sp. NPDC096077]|uniref:hypothetical protein n=1 Tax=Kitasatospora sp. NPDC096077 TaxID=3155544 RepID=UPI00332587E6
MSAKASKLIRVALAAAIAASGAIATTAVTVTTASASSVTSGQISRSEILARAQYWYGKSIGYNQGGSYPDQQGAYYRTDCSGYVSMAWHLQTPGLNTQGLPGVATEIPRSQLKPGDILNSYYDHVILFEKWDDAAHTTFSYYSFGSTPVKHRTGVSISAPSFDSHPNGDYKAYRYNKVIDDVSTSWDVNQAVTASATGSTTRLNLIGSDGALYNTDGNYASGSWTNQWARLDGSALKAVTSVSLGNVVHVFALGSNGQVYGKDADYNTGAWSNWTEVPGGAAGATSLAASITGTTVHLQIVGSDGALYGTDGDYAGGGWSGAWGRLDGSGLKALTSVSNGNVVHVFALGADGRIFGKDADYSIGKWSNWAEVPGGAAGAKGLTASMTGNSVHLEIIGSDNALYNTDGNYSGGGWTGTWSKIDTRQMKSLSSTVIDNVMHVYGVGTDDHVYTIDANYNTGQWNSWAEVPGGAVATS